MKNAVGVLSITFSFLWLLYFEKYFGARCTGNLWHWDDIDDFKSAIIGEVICIPSYFLLRMGRNHVLLIYSCVLAGTTLLSTSNKRGSKIQTWATINKRPPFF